MADAEFLSSLIKACDPYIRKYGGQEGYQRFRADEAQNMSQCSSVEDVAKGYIDSINNNEAESPFYARVLLSMYFTSERYGGAPPILKDWVHERLLQISDGEGADDALHLKHRAGVRRTKPMHNHAQCACFVALKIREGMNKSAAVQACTTEYGIAERHVYRALRGMEIPDDVSIETLMFFCDNDISSDYLAY